MPDTNHRIDASGFAPSEFMMGVWERRDDLRTAFPDPFGESRNAFWHWFLTVGFHECGLATPLPQDLLAWDDQSTTDFLTSVIYPNRPDLYRALSRDTPDLRARLLGWWKEYGIFEYFSDALIKHNCKGVPKRKTGSIVLFLVFDHAIWKCEAIYRSIAEEGALNPVICVIPWHVGTDREIEERFDRTLAHFTETGHAVFNPRDEQTGRWKDPRILDPLYVFFSSPWAHTAYEFRIENFLDRYTCYVPYGIMQAAIPQQQYNQRFHNLLWRHFVETDFHRQLAEQYSDCKGVNVVMSGYPYFDELRRYLEADKPVFEYGAPENAPVLEIIWAPHWTVGNVGSNIPRFSNFYKYRAFFRQLSDLYGGRIAVIFRPHPVLRSALAADPDFGEADCNDYYNAFRGSPHNSFSEGEYADTFHRSAAMITDSVSFISEYLVTGKPLLFLATENGSVDQQFNDFGRMSIENAYVARSQADIKAFIDNTVIEGKDPMRARRKAFVERYFPSAHSPSRFIARYLLTHATAARAESGHSIE